LFTSIVYSSQSDFETPKTCTQTFGQSCDNTTFDFDDAFGPCNGTQSPVGDVARVKEAYINASSFFYDDGINVTCTFRRLSSGNNSMEIWYNDTTNWYLIRHWDKTTIGTENETISFKVNSSEGVHVVRCMIRYCSSGACDITGNCVNSTYAQYYDNDDVNFTVTDYLRYTFWNLTNSTTPEIGSGGTYNRSVNLTISAGWNKNISYAVVEHNGTGTWVNYTLSPSGNWTNYTLVLSNRTEFNHTTIAIRSIYANDTFGVENNTSPLIYFYLDSGDPPTVSDIGFYQGDNSISTSNLFTGISIKAFVYDDVSLSTAIANITYPTGYRINATMTGVDSPDGSYWTFTFNDTVPLNETGTYTATVIVRDIGGQENESSSIASLTVNSTYTLQSLSNSTYNRGENITVGVLDINSNSVTTLNWTVNLTKFNISEPSILNEQNSGVSFQINNTDPAGNYTMFVNVSKLGNSGNRTYNFNVSNELNVSTSTSLSSPTTLQTAITVSVSVYNARSTLHNSTFAANISCHNSSFIYNMNPLSFSSSNASFTCYSPNAYSTNFNITVNLTDTNNNTGTSIINLTTASAPSSDGTTTGGGGGGGGGGVVQNITIINATANATTGFNFTLSTTEIQIYRGEDGTIVGELSNTGNTNLTITSSIYLNSTCCIIILNPSEFILEVGGAEVPFTISIHVNISTEPDTEHFADIKLKSGTLEKSKRIKIIVKENPTISSISQVTGQITEVEEKIREYATLGLNVGFLEDLLNKIKGTKADSTTAIEQDDINQLKQYDNFIQSSLKQINDELNKLTFLKIIYENKWNIGSGITVGIISTYLVIQVLIPYSRIELEIRKLVLERDSLTKSRVETTKSFFLRKIDDRTFRSIITEGQGKIYKLKSMIDLKNEEKYNLLRTRLNPLSLGKWIKQKITKIRTEKK